MEFPADRVSALIGAHPIEWFEAEGGHTRAGRWRISAVDGSRAFVKAGGGPDAAAIRREQAVLSSLSGSFHPRLHGFDDMEDVAILVTEDLSRAMWPPPFPEDRSLLFEALEEMADHRPPEGLPQLRRAEASNWRHVARDPDGLRELEVCSGRWLERALDSLVQAELRFDPTGDVLVHNDLWSGNMAFEDERCVFIDWSEAHLGSRWVDRGFAILSLRSDGGLLETDRFPGDAAFASWWSASLARRLIGGVESWLDPEIEVGLRQDLGVALRWAAQLLELPPPR